MMATEFDPEGAGYDFNTALEIQKVDPSFGPDETGHWPSRDPRTGVILKGKSHPTFFKTEEADKQLGYAMSKGKDGRYYSQPASLDARFPQREPFPAERDFFLNQEVSGLPPDKIAQGIAAEDNKVTLNPFSLQGNKDKEGVKQNEQIRLYLRNNHPDITFHLSPEQREAFKTYGYQAKTPRERDQAVRDTIMARILTGDPSAGTATPEQQAIAQQIEKEISQPQGTR